MQLIHVVKFIRLWFSNKKNLQVSGENLPLLVEFKKHGVLSTIEGSPTVIPSLYQCFVVKKELYQKSKFLIYQSNYIPTITSGQIWVMTEVKIVGISKHKEFS